MVKKSNRKKGVLAILSVSLILISSLAFFTDNKTNGVRGGLGSLSISTDLTFSEHLNNVAPGDALGLDLGVTNDGTLDADIRHIYRLSVPEEDIDKYPIGGLSLHANGVEVVSVVNNDTYVPFGVLGAGDSESLKLEIGVDPSLVNDIQGHSFKLEILTEAKQLNSSDWVELGTDKVKFGGRDDFKVVPSNNLIKVANNTILRSPVPEVGATGFVRVFMNLVNTYTPSEFKEEFLNPADDLKIYSPEGVLYGDDEIVKVGSLVKLERDGVVYDTVVVVVIGDVNLDGRINIGDYTQMHVLDRYGRGINVDTVDAPTFLQLIAADIDGDGYVTDVDLRLMSEYMSDIIQEYPLYHPQKPYGVRIPNLELVLGDNQYDSTEDLSSAWDLGVIHKQGSEVKRGEVIKVAIDIKSLRGLDIIGTFIGVDYDESLVEVFEDLQYPGEGFWFSELGDGFGLSPYDRRGRPVFDYSVEDITGGIVDINLRNGDNSNSELLPLTGGGTHLILGFKVKEDAPIGSEIKFNTINEKFTYKGYGGVNFYEDFIGADSVSLTVVE